jgi:hypothetical protein
MPGGYAQGQQVGYFGRESALGWKPRLTDRSRHRQTNPRTHTLPSSMTNLLHRRPNRMASLLQSRGKTHKLCRTRRTDRAGVSHPRTHPHRRRHSREATLCREGTIPELLLLPPLLRQEAPTFRRHRAVDQALYTAWSKLSHTHIPRHSSSLLPR